MGTGVLALSAAVVYLSPMPGVYALCFVPLPCFALCCRIKARAAQRRQQEVKQAKQEQQREVNKADPQFANFEKFTKGEAVATIMGRKDA